VRRRITTSQATRGASLRSSGLHSSLKTPSLVRAKVVGVDIQYPAGTSLRGLMGYNWGTYGTVRTPQDAALAIADGAKIVRVVSNFRWDGTYNVANTDSRDDSSFAHFDARNWALMKAVVKSLTDAGVWVIVVFDSDYRVNAVEGSGQGTAGDNIFTNGSTLGLVREIWKMAAREFATYPWIFAYELTSEPMVDASFDATWEPQLRAVYRSIISTVRLVDKLTPFVLGGRGGYSKSTISTCILSERTDCIYTWDLLSTGLSNVSSVPGNFDLVQAVTVAANAPLFCNQLGTNSDEDVNDYGLRAGLRLAKWRGVIATWWEMVDRYTGAGSQNHYGLRYYDSSLVLTDKPRLAYFKSVLAETPAGLEAAAIAAATAAGAWLFYVKADLSNVWSDVGATTHPAIGAKVARLDPVVGSSTTLNLQQATGANQPTLVQAATPYLIDQRPVLSFDGATSYLSGSSIFFASGDDMTVIGASIPANTGTVQVLIEDGTSNSTVHYPRLGFLATKVPVATWEGDDAVVNSCTGVTSTGGFPCVMSAVKAGANKQLFVNGVQDGATNTGTVGAATITRLRVGATSVNIPNFNGPVALVCVCKAGMTAAQRQAIELFGAYLVGAGYQV
jgi:hypothetical protein